MNIFLDHNMPPRFARALHELLKDDGFQFYALQDKFPRDTADEVWVRELSREGRWLVLSRDRKMKNSPTIRHAWRESKLIGFFLARAWENHDLIAQMSRLLSWWPILIEFEKRLAAGSIVEIPYKTKAGLRPYKQ